MSPRAVVVKWASRQIHLRRGGHLAGVRYGGARIDVAYVAWGADRLLWVDPQKVADKDELIRWMQRSEFNSH